MHDLAGRNLANAGEAFPRRVHFVVAELCRFWPLRFLFANRIVHVRFMEKGALLLVKVEEASSQNALADFAHKLVVEMDVVFAEQLPTKRLARLGQVVEIRPRITSAGRAIAGRIEFFVCVFVNAPPHLQEAAGSEDRAALRELRRHDAIEHVHAAMNGFQDIERGAHPHQIARLVFRKKLRRELAHLFALVSAFAYGQPANGKAVERHLPQLSRAFAPQLRKERALHDGEHRLRRIPPRL
jgi:hypothetical protein